mgnify:CR=1 FL=1
MQNVLFLNTETPSKAEVKRLDEHLIQIIGDVEKNTSGFHLINDVGSVYGKYEDFTTLYKEIEGGFVLSNDGSVYVEPEPVPEPEPYVPTLEEVQEAKVAQMNTAQQAAIQAGVDIELTDGATEHFSLTDHDQTSLIGLQGRVDAGEEQIPWHTSDESEHCKFYTNADMAMITSAAMEYVTWHITYFRDLRIYIRSLQTKGEVEAVTYGMDIPQEYQSEPLRAMIAAKHL